MGIDTEEESTERKDDDTIDCRTDRQTALSEMGTNISNNLYVPECTPDGRYKKVPTQSVKWQEEVFKMAWYCRSSATRVLGIVGAFTRIREKTFPVRRWRTKCPNATSRWRLTGASRDVQMTKKLYLSRTSWISYSRRWKRISTALVLRGNLSPKEFLKSSNVLSYRHLENNLK